MSLSLPPIAFMMPISRVRSRIDITIVLTMPSDDTASAIDPIRLRTMSRMMKARLAPCSASFSENAVKPSFLIRSSTSCVDWARALHVTAVCRSATCATGRGAAPPRPRAVAASDRLRLAERQHQRRTRRRPAANGRARARRCRRCGHVSFGALHAQPGSAGIGSARRRRRGRPPRSSASAAARPGFPDPAR